MKNWSQCSLGELCEIQRGGSPRPIDQYITNSEDGINWIKIGDVAEGAKYINTTKEKIKPEGAARSRHVSNGEFLLTNSMSFGRPYILRTSGCIHDGWLVLRYDKERLDEDYLYRVLSSDLVYAQFVKFAAGAVVKNLNSDVVKQVTIPVPPIKEQRRLAAILDRADALREKRKEALALLDGMAQSIFIDAFGDPASNEKGWSMCDLDELVAESDSINYGVVQPGDEYEDGVPLVRVGDLFGGRVNHNALKRISPTIEKAYARSRLQGDEILVSCVGSIGVVAMTSEREAGFNIARAVARIRLSNHATRRFMAAQLRTPGIQRYFNQELRTVSQPTLNIKQICKTRVMLPPMKEQQAFEEMLAPLSRCEDLFQRAMESANTLFASLQHRAFAGDL
jgi:type I restriction enzyme, S subunit